MSLPTVTSPITGNELRLETALRNLIGYTHDIPRGVWMAENSTSGRTMAWHVRRGDLQEVVHTSRVTGNPVSAITAILNAQEKATQSRDEAREIKAMIKAMAEKQDELLNGQGQILAAVEAAEKAVTINADEVEVTVRSSDEGLDDEDELADKGNPTEGED